MLSLFIPGCRSTWNSSRVARLLSNLFFLRKSRKIFPSNERPFFLLSMNYSCSIVNGSATQSERTRRSTQLLMTPWWTQICCCPSADVRRRKFSHVFFSVFDDSRQEKNEKDSSFHLTESKPPFWCVVCLCVRNCSALPLNYSMKSDPALLLYVKRLIRPRISLMARFGGLQGISKNTQLRIHVSSCLLFFRINDRQIHKRRAKIRERSEKFFFFLSFSILCLDFHDGIEETIQNHQANTMVPSRTWRKKSLFFGHER